MKENNLFWFKSAQICGIRVNPWNPRLILPPFSTIRVFLSTLTFSFSRRWHLSAVAGQNPKSPI
jgi:hypothetical protein